MMTNEESTEIVSFMTPGAGGLVSRCDHKSHKAKSIISSPKLLYFGGWFKQTQKDSFDDVPINFYCINW